MKKLSLVKQELLRLFKKNNISADEVNKLLCEVLKIDFSKLILLDEISNFNYLKIKHYAKKRISGKPLTKIFKKAYFYGLEFHVNKFVLSPRQETELLVAEALKIIKPNSKVLDLCTGSGCNAVSVCKNSTAKVYASDISKKALKVANFNAKKHGVDIEFIKSNLFENINEKFDVIISNPPYIESKTINSLDREVKYFDPVLALDGGEDGLTFYKKIIQELDNHLNKDGTILLEIGYNQASNVKKLLKENSFDSICLKDYENKDRIIIGKRIKSC